MTKKRSTEPEPIVAKCFTFEEIERGIEKMKRRFDEVKNLDPQKIDFRDTKVRNVEGNIRDTIREVFGERSPEYSAHGDHMIWHGSLNYLDAEHIRQKKFSEGIPQTLTMLEGLIARLEEKRADVLVNPKSLASVAFQGMNLHSRIADVSRDLYKNGHYPQAVLDASKALVNLVKEKSGRHDLDGSGLMTTVFSVSTPILSFNDLSDQSDRDEQLGMMHLFQGAVLAIRNPRGHSFLTDSPERALEYIGLLSMLANRLEEARRKP